MKTNHSDPRQAVHTTRQIQQYWYELKRALRDADAQRITSAQQRLDYLLARL